MADTDNDGFTDGEEIAAGTDPLENTLMPTVGPDGDANGDGYGDVRDLLRATQTLIGQYLNLTQEELDRWEVVPLVNGVPQPNGKNNVGDYLILQKKVMGIVDF